MPGTSRFRACWTTPTFALHAVTPLYGGKCMQRVFGPLFQARKRTEDARKRGVPGVFVDGSGSRGRFVTSPARDVHGGGGSSRPGPAGARSGAPGAPGRPDPCRLPDAPGSRDLAEPCHLPGAPESRERPGPWQLPTEPPRVPGVSWRSQPARTSMRRPGPTSDGRNGLNSAVNRAPRRAGRRPSWRSLGPRVRA